MNKHTKENIKNKYKDIKRHCKVYECACACAGVGVATVIFLFTAGLVYFEGCC